MPLTFLDPVIQLSALSPVLGVPVPEVSASERARNHRARAGQDQITEQGASAGAQQRVAAAVRLVALVAALVPVMPVVVVAVAMDAAARSGARAWA